MNAGTTWGTALMGSRARAAAVLGLLLAAAACDRAGDEPQAEDATTALEQVLVAPGADSASPAAAGASPPAAAGPRALATVPGAPVHGRTGPGGTPFEVARRTPAEIGHARRIGRRTFDLALRSEELGLYPCASCHLPGAEVVQTERIGDAHGDIQPVHPSESEGRCLNCHAVDDVERLELASGERVGLDHAYRLCAQCHFAQVDTWAGGAHGKRLDGWRGPRVVMGCADCHDPHRPAVQPRIPYPGPQLPGRKEGSP